MNQFEWKTVDSLHSASKPSARWGHSCCVIDRNFYLFGGFANSTYMNDFWQYSLVDLQWKELTTTGDNPECRSNATLSYDSINHQLLLFGGGGPNKQRFNSISILDLNTLNWVEILPFENETSPWERTYHIAQFVSPYLVIFGGESFDDLGDLWTYNINTLSWTEIKLPATSPRPSARRFHSSCLIGNILYIFGGCFGKYICLNDLYSLDLTPLKQNNQVTELVWQEIPLTSAIDPRWGHSLHYYNGQLYIFGGRAIQDMCDLIAVKPQNGFVRFLRTRKQPQARRRHSGGFIGSSLVLFGGFDGNYFDDFIYINIYQPSLNPKIVPITIEKINENNSNHTIKCIDNIQIHIHTSMIGRYFQTEYQMCCFLQAIDGNYHSQEIQETLKSMEDGFGYLPLKTCHRQILDYHPSDSSETIQQAILQIIHEGSPCYISVNQQIRPVILQLHLVHKYLSWINQHWQNDDYVVFNQTKCGINRNKTARQSQYFSHLFSKQYCEKDCANVQVNECSSFNFKLLLGYLFTGVVVVPRHSSITVFLQLLHLAEYFSIASLVNICQKQLCNHITSQNYKQLLEVSTSFNLQRLTQHCSYKYLNQFIITQSQKIVIEEQLHPKIKELYKHIQFDLIHSSKKIGSQKSTVLNEQNDKQNRPTNYSSLKASIK